ncbi:antitoxin VbhA family protein [Psychrobacter sp. 1U2]|uniref:antitoxin VbhA family protein n=1 Tax=unclassified Psychrobacter TaxID=196806 RepID=UPI00352EC812|tara:strand:- start:169 stop:417 length:249 start_codon:yes stop_codon:yes gene_type:complete
MEDSKSKTPIVDDRPILVSRQEIEKRRRINFDTLGSFAVDNIPVNPDTQHIFQDFEEGKIATSKEVKALLHAHYTKVALGDN